MRRMLAAALLAAATLGRAEGLDGVFVGYRTAMMPDPYGRARVDPRKDHFVLFPDGGVYWKLPQDGPDGLDLRREVQQRPELVGAYQLHGDSIVVRWATGQTAVAMREGNGFRFDRDAYVAVPKSSGLRLEGAYSRQDGTAPQRVIQFRSDGVFQDSGVLGVVGLLYMIPVGGGYARPEYEVGQPGWGRYEIRNNTLYLAYVDGRVKRVAFYVLSNSGYDSSPAMIFLNSYALSRR